MLRSDVTADMAFLNTVTMS